MDGLVGEEVGRHTGAILVWSLVAPGGHFFPSHSMSFSCRAVRYGVEENNLTAAPPCPYYFIHKRKQLKSFKCFNTEWALTNILNTILSRSYCFVLQALHHLNPPPNHKVSFVLGKWDTIFQLSVLWLRQLLYLASTLLRNIIIKLYYSPFSITYHNGSDIS